MILTWRPIDHWPGEPTKFRKPSPFRSGWESTLDLMERELTQLRAKNVVLMVAVTENEVRLNGQIRADARPSHPGVILAFDSKHGPLKYPCDLFNKWQDNVRAIALALEALRKVDRYGITKVGEQYTGWKALGSGIAMSAGMNDEEAAAFICTSTEDDAWAPPTNLPTCVESMVDRSNPARVESITYAFRLASKRLHPDQGGNEYLFRKLNDARAVLID